MTSWHQVTSRYDVTWHHTMNLCVSLNPWKKGLLHKRTVQYGKRGRYVNAQAFSSDYNSVFKVGPTKKILSFPVTRPTHVKNPRLKIFFDASGTKLTFQVNFFKFTATFSFSLVSFGWRFCIFSWVYTEISNSSCSIFQMSKFQNIYRDLEL